MTRYGGPDGKSLGALSLLTKITWQLPAVAGASATLIGTVCQPPAIGLFFPGTFSSALRDR